MMGRKKGCLRRKAPGEKRHRSRKKKKKALWRKKQERSAPESDLEEGGERKTQPPSAKKGSPTKGLVRKKGPKCLEGKREEERLPE